MRIAVASLALALTGAALAAPQVQAAAPAVSSSARPAYAAPPIHWGRCDDASLRAGKARCGDLVVPLDWANPSGPTITVAVARVKHTAEPYRGVMLTNPGGPGGEGRWVATLGQYVPGQVASTYDWIGLDPRGVGASRPALSCDGGYFSFHRPPYVPSTAAIRDAWLAKTQQYAADCGTSAAKDLLGHVKSTDTIADFEALRGVLGVRKVSYYGFSYGTYLGELYATLHPNRIKRMVLDGVIDPAGVWYQGNLDQDPAFQKVIGRFFGWIAKAPEAYHLGRTRRAVFRTYRTLLRTLAARPIRGIGPAELSDAILGAGYNVYSWPDAAKVLAAIKKGNAKPARAAYRSDNPVGKGADNGYAMYLATQCTDAAWPTDWGTWETDNWAMHARAPYLTWANAWFNAPCRTWPAPAGTPVTVDGSRLAKKILLISEQYDAATPYAGAKATRSLFPTASLIEGVGGTTHAASLYGVGCVDGRIEQYLIDGTTPDRKKGDRADVRCPGLAPPKPGARVLPHRAPVAVR
jgi:pimeloyl-ACP methyl ester carboxylesterase